MKKILIIGQALPAVKQQYPYDSTLLYDWLSECKISKEKAQEMFDFEAVYDKFPGFNENGKGHKKPSQEQMVDHWKATLQDKVLKASKIWILGTLAADFIYNRMEENRSIYYGKKFLRTIHPSKMNWNLYQKNKVQILQKLKSFLYDNHNV